MEVQLNGFSEPYSNGWAEEDGSQSSSDELRVYNVNGITNPENPCDHKGNRWNNTLTVACDGAPLHGQLPTTSGTENDQSLTGNESTSLSLPPLVSVPDSNGDLHNRKFDTADGEVHTSGVSEFENHENKAIKNESQKGIESDSKKEIGICVVSDGKGNYANGFSSDYRIENNSRSNNAGDMPMFSQVENEPNESSIDQSSRKTLYQITLSEDGKPAATAATEWEREHIDECGTKTQGQYRYSDQHSEASCFRNHGDITYSGDDEVPKQDIQSNDPPGSYYMQVENWCQILEEDHSQFNGVVGVDEGTVHCTSNNFTSGEIDFNVENTRHFDQLQTIALDYIAGSYHDDDDNSDVDRGEVENQSTEANIGADDHLEEDNDSVSDSISQSTDCQSTCSTQSEWMVTRSWQFLHSYRNTVSQADHVIDTITTDLHSKFACISIPHAWADNGQCLNDHSKQLPSTEAEHSAPVSDRVSVAKFSEASSSDKSSDQTVPSDCKSQDGLSDDLEFFYDDEFATGFNTNLADIDMGMLNSDELHLCSSLSDVLSRSQVRPLGQASKMKVKAERCHYDSDYDLSRTSTACSSLLSVGSSNVAAGLDSTSSSENPKMLFISGEFDYSSPYLCEELLQTVDRMSEHGHQEQQPSEMHCNEYDEYDISNLPYEHMFLLPHEATAASDTFSISDFEKEHFFSCKDLMQSDEMLDFPPHPPKESANMHGGEESPYDDEAHLEYPSYVSSSGEFSDLGYSPLFSPSKESTGIAHVSSGSATTGSNASSLRDVINCDPYSTRQNYMLTFADGGSCSPTKQLHDSYQDADTSDASQHLTTWAERAKVFDEKGVETVKHFNSPISDKTSPGSGNSNHTCTFRGANSTPSSGNSQSTTKPGFTTWAQQRLAKESGYLRAGLTSWKHLQEIQHAKKMRQISDWSKSRSMPDLAKHTYPTAPKSSMVAKKGEENSGLKEEGQEVKRRQAEHDKDERKRFSGTLIEIFQRMRSNSESYNFSEDFHGSHLCSSYDFHHFNEIPPVPQLCYLPKGKGDELQGPGDMPAMLKSLRVTSMQTSPVHDCWCKIHQMAQVQMSPAKRSFGMQFPPNVMDTSVQTSAHLMVSLHTDHIDHSQQTSIENKESKGVFLIDTTVQTSAELEQNRKLDRSLFFANRSLPDVSFLSKSSASSISAMFRFSFSSEQKTFYCAPKVTVDEKTGKVYALIPRKSAAGRMFDMKTKGSASCILTQNLPASKTELSAKVTSGTSENTEANSKSKSVSPLALPSVAEKSTKKNQVLQISPHILEGEVPSLSSSSSSGVESGSDYSQRSPRIFPEDILPENRKLGTQTFSKSEEQLSKVSAAGRGRIAPKKPLRSCLRKKALLEKRKRSLSDPYGYSTIPYTNLSEGPRVCRGTDCKCNVCLQGTEGLNFTYTYKKSTSFDVRSTPGSLIDSGQVASNFSGDSEEGAMGAESLNTLQLSAAAKCVCIPQSNDTTLPKSHSDCTAIRPKSQCPVCSNLVEDGQEMTSKVKKTVSFANEVDFHSPSPSPSPAPTPFESPLHSPKRQNRLKLAIEHPLAKDVLPPPPQVTKIEDAKPPQEQRSVSPASDSDSDSPPPCDFLPSPTFESPSSSVHSTEPVSEGEKEGHFCSDSDSDAGPPGEFRISPCAESPPALPLVSSKRSLVMEVIKARDVILQHFSRAKDPVQKLQLLSTEDTPAVGHLVQDHLCRAIQHILSDGLKPELLSLFGKVKNSEWRVVEASTELGPSTKALHELVQRLETLTYLSTTQTKLDAFIFGLLNLRALGYWLKHLQGQEKGIVKHYLKDAFLFLSLSSEQQNFQDVITAVKPLSSLPFHLEYTAVYAEKHDDLPEIKTPKEVIMPSGSPKRATGTSSPKKNRPHSYPDNPLDRRRRVHQEFRRSLSTSTESQESQSEYSSLPQGLDSSYASSVERQRPGWFRTLMTNSFGGFLGSKKANKDKGMTRHNSDNFPRVSNSPKRNLAEGKRELTENSQKVSLEGSLRVGSEQSSGLRDRNDKSDIETPGHNEAQTGSISHQASGAPRNYDSLSSEKSIASSPKRDNVSNKMENRNSLRNKAKQVQKIIDNNEIVTKEYEEKCATEENKVGFLRRISRKISSVTQKAAYKKGITEYSFDNQGNVVQNNCNNNNNNVERGVSENTVANINEEGKNDDVDDGVDVDDGYGDEEGDSSETIVNTTSSESPETPQTCKLPFACAESGKSHHKSQSVSSQSAANEYPTRYPEISADDSSKEVSPAKSRFSWNKFGSGLIRAFDKVFANEKSPKSKDSLLARRRTQSETQVNVALDSKEVEQQFVLKKGVSVPGIMPMIERRKQVDKSYSSERFSSGSDSIYHSAQGASSYNLNAETETDPETCEEYAYLDSSLSSGSSGFENSGRRKKNAENLMAEIDEQEVCASPV
ncbi:uncharacterized protein LOC106169948 isoform X4 [Lingula anatina]|uniref:Uncharacterized protein LOC106169948 isoform X4 n=1 Tax=Lingula anatina TaxID=7574 RepID=A0A1S3J486_LINAN|nr:uncharacterized protein LOC106169948 isoform X4 [Lingula anatina]|eukprot:XP_013405076.1 uncharacterized protein LOC106169948 isoform X4 [Lingula anatina]